MSRASAELLVGIDVGTTMTKAVVVGADGREISWGNAPTPWKPVHSGAEADPADFLRVAMRATRTALNAAPPGRVVGMGVTSMAGPWFSLDRTEAQQPRRSPGTTHHGSEEVRDSPASSATTPSRNSPACPSHRCAPSPSSPGLIATVLLRSAGRST